MYTIDQQVVTRIFDKLDRITEKVNSIEITVTRLDGRIDRLSEVKLEEQDVRLMFADCQSRRNKKIKEAKEDKEDKAKKSDLAEKALGVVKASIWPLTVALMIIGRLVGVL